MKFQSTELHSHPMSLTKRYVSFINNRNDAYRYLSCVAIEPMQPHILFSTEEFMAGVRAKRRRVGWEKTDELFTLANLRVDARVREMHCGSRAIDLTHKEFELLKYLISHPRQVMTFQQILGDVWPRSVLRDSRNIVQVYVRSLRRKLGKAADLLQTVRGVGYVLKDSSVIMA